MQGISLTVMQSEIPTEESLHFACAAVSYVPHSSCRNLLPWWRLLSCVYWFPSTGQGEDSSWTVVFKWAAAVVETWSVQSLSWCCSWPLICLYWKLAAWL